MPRFNAVLAEASFEARQFHSGVRPRSRHSSMSATHARVARPCRLKGILVSIESDAYFELSPNTDATLAISSPTIAQNPKKSRAISVSSALAISPPSYPRTVNSFPVLSARWATCASMLESTRCTLASSPIPRTCHRLTDSILASLYLNDLVETI